MTLAELTEERGDADLPPKMVQPMAQHLRCVDVESRCGAGYDAKALGTRLSHRNGLP